MPTSIRLQHSSKTQIPHGGAGPNSRWLSLAAAALISVSAAAHGDAPVTKVADDAALKAVFADFIRPGQPGCGIGVMRDGVLLQASAYGLSDLATHEPLDAGSVFSIASISKQFTAYSILLLDQRKALSIDDPLIK